MRLFRRCTSPCPARADPWAARLVGSPSGRGRSAGSAAPCGGCSEHGVRCAPERVGQPRKEDDRHVDGAPLDALKVSGGQPGQLSQALLRLPSPDT